MVLPVSMRYASLALRRDMLRVGCNSRGTSHFYYALRRTLHSNSFSVIESTPIRFWDPYALYLIVIHLGALASQRSYVLTFWAFVKKIN